MDKVSSILNADKAEKKSPLPQILFVIFIVVISVTAFVFAINLSKNSDVAPEDSEASERKYPSLAIRKKCTTVADCNNLWNTCEVGYCETVEYPNNGDSIKTLDFVQFIPKAVYYKYSFSQNGEIIHESPQINNGSYMITSQNKDYSKFKSGALNVKVIGWNNTNQMLTPKYLTLNLTIPVTPTKVVTPRPTLTHIPRPSYTPIMRPSLIPTTKIVPTTTITMIPTTKVIPTTTITMVPTITPIPTSRGGIPVPTTPNSDM